MNEAEEAVNEDVAIEMDENAQAALSSVEMQQMLEKWKGMQVTSKRGITKSPYNNAARAKRKHINAIAKASRKQNRK